MRGRARYWGLLALAALLLGGCGSSHTAHSVTTATASAPPGTGRPRVTIGDKNFTEEFVLGQLYRQALVAKGYTVDLNPNIGPTEVTLQALASGRLDMYPEYLNVWNRAVAGYRRSFSSLKAAYGSARRYAHRYGLTLLAPTPFSDTSAAVVGFNYAAHKGLNTIGDLRKVADSMTFGGPPQFAQSSAGLPAIEQAYGFQPAAYKALDVGQQYQALDQGLVQAAAANTTDGQLVSGNYAVLADPKHVFGWGQVVPVVSAKVLAAEGPAFVRTVNAVSALLTLDVIRQLNAEIDLDHEEPSAVAKQFLIAHGLVPNTTS